MPVAWRAAAGVAVGAAEATAWRQAGEVLQWPRSIAQAYIHIGIWRALSGSALHR